MFNTKRQNNKLEDHFVKKICKFWRWIIEYMHFLCHRLTHTHRQTHLRLFYKKDYVTHTIMIVIYKLKREIPHKSIKPRVQIQDLYGSFFQSRPFGWHILVSLNKTCKGLVWNLSNGEWNYILNWILTQRFSIRFKTSNPKCSNKVENIGRDLINPFQIELLE